MKKCLIFLGSLLVSFFLFSNNVKAIENTYYINKVMAQSSSNIYNVNIPISYEQLNNSFTFDTTEYSDFYSQKSGYLKCGYELYNQLSNGNFDNVKNNYDYWFIVANSYNYTQCGIYYFNKNDVVLRYTNENQNVSWLTLFIKSAYFYKRSNYSYNNITNNNLSTSTRYLLHDHANNYAYSNYSSWDSGNHAVVLFSSEDALKNVFGNPINPTISISKIGDIYFENDITKPIMGADLSINFSEFNTTKYIYEYSTDLDNWSTLVQNDSQIILYDNITLYVRIKDLNNNILTSSTYTVTTIDKIPRIYLDIDINDDETAKWNFERTIYTITFTYYNMSEDYYSIYYNLTDGTSKNLGYNIQEYVLNYVNDDAILTVYIYDKNNNMIDHATIDLNLLNKDLNSPYIQLFGQDMVNTKNSVAYTYNNTNDNDHKCYYQFGGDDEPTQESCSTENIIVRHASYNTYLHIYIKDNNNNILDEKMIQLSFFIGYPRLEFESYYSGISKSQLLNIKMLDYTENDKLYYSTDNENWTQLPTQDLNTLYFTENTAEYFKIKRTNASIAACLY